MPARTPRAFSIAASYFALVPRWLGVCHHTAPSGGGGMASRRKSTQARCSSSSGRWRTRLAPVAIGPPVAFRPLGGAVVLESVVCVEATFHLDRFQVFVGFGLAPDAPAEHLPNLALVAVLLAVCVDLLHGVVLCDAKPSMAEVVQHGALE